MHRLGLLRVGFAVALAVVASTAQAEQLTYTDGVCQHAVAYDARTVDGPALKATFDYLFDQSSTVELPPPYKTAADVAAIDVPAYRAKCAAHRARLTSRHLLDLTSLAALRDAEVAALDASCRRTEAALSAAKGDVAAARALAPACTRWTDLLALPEAQLKTRFNDLVVDLCEGSTQRNVCAGQMQRDGEGPGSATRRRLAVLDAWTRCATGPEPDIAARKQRIRDLVGTHFKARTLSCAQ